MMIKKMTISKMRLRMIARANASNMRARASNIKASASKVNM